VHEEHGQAGYAGMLIDNRMAIPECRCKKIIFFFEAKKFLLISAKKYEVRLMEFMEQMAEFSRLLQNSQRIVVFTGAGISTEAGIPDYRSQGGIWNKFKPVYIQEFMKSEEQRILYWRRKKEMWKPLKNAKPTAMHRWIFQLEKAGKLHGLITQNIDGLHEKSGVSLEKIVNLHGNTLGTVCLQCQKIVDTEKIIEEWEANQPAPRCAKCGGLLKPNTISFGQMLNENDLIRSEKISKECDMFIALGSSLVVYPAAMFPQVAKQNGAVLAILNAAATPLDSIADLAIHARFRKIEANL